MTKKQYRITLIVLIGSFLLSIPISFTDIQDIKDLVDNNKIFFAIESLVVSLLFYWPTLLIYFKQKKFKAIFYLGIISAIAYNLLILTTFFGDFENQKMLVFFVIVSLFYMISSLLFSMSIIFSRKTKHLKLFRSHGLFGLIGTILYIVIIFSGHQEFFFIGSLIWVIESILLILHFIYERNLTPQSIVSDEILDVG